MTNDEVKEIAWMAWKGAANAHRMYPENKHTFTEYWRGAESQFNKFCKADVMLSLPSIEKMIKSRIADAFDNGMQNFEKKELENALDAIKRLIPPSYFEGNGA